MPAMSTPRQGPVSPQTWGQGSAPHSHLAPPPWVSRALVTLRLPLVPPWYFHLYWHHLHGIWWTPLTMSLWFTPPGSLTQAIRNFAKSLEGWLINAMSGFPQQVIQTKVPSHMGLGDPLAPLYCPGHFPCVSRKMGLPRCCEGWERSWQGKNHRWPWR